jgi:Zn-finger nucleic acid-binding protein
MAVEAEAPAGARICPACGAELVNLDRDGILIDRCPNCRGIWLDRGELEKLLANGHAESHYERPASEAGEEPEAGERLATRRSFFAELFDLE